MNHTYLRGDMYYAVLEPGMGSEQYGKRPVLIIQNNAGNKYSSTVIIAAITSKVGVKPKLPTHYFLEAGTSGLQESSIILFEQIRTISKQRLESYIGQLSKRHIQKMNHALAVSIGLIEETPKDLTLCLCPACANNFYGTGSYFLRRVHSEQVEKNICTYCNQRAGYDYQVIHRSK